MSFDCPHCGTALELADEYLAAYGGRATTCSHCGQAITLPTLAAGAGVPADAALDYERRAPLDMMGTGGAWADGRYAVVGRDATLPARCYRCNVPVVGKPARFRVGWRRGATSISPIFALFEILAGKETLNFKAHECPKHAANRFAMAALGPFLGVVGVMMVVVAVWLMVSGSTPAGRSTAPPPRGRLATPAAPSGPSASDGPLLFLGGVLVALVGAGLWAAKLQNPKASVIGREAARVSGFGLPFLDSLPPLAGSADGRAQRFAARFGVRGDPTPDAAPGPVPPDASTTLPCPHCGLGLRLTHDYLTRFGGKVTTCTGCRKAFTLPSADDAFGPASAWATSRGGATSVWRDGDAVYVARGGLLPPRCVVCNAAGTRTVNVRLLWHPNGDVRQMAEGEVNLRASYCDAHASETKRHKSASLVIIAALCVGLPVIGLVALGGYGRSVNRWIALGTLVPIVSVAGLLLRVAGPRLRLASYDDGGAHVEGFGEPFLRSLPSINAARAAAARAAGDRVANVTE